MLRIKRSVQSAFNTEASYIAAQAAAARLGQQANKMDEDDSAAAAAADPMAALEGGGATKGPSFVAAKQKAFQPTTAEGQEAEAPATQANPDEIEMDEDDF